MRTVVVGGGVAGLSFALAMAARGEPSIVLEARHSEAEIDRGDVLQPASRRLLSDWGAWEMLQAHTPGRLRFFRVCDNDGRLLLEIDSQALLGEDYFFSSTRHPNIVSSLVKTAEQTGMIELRRSERVVDLIQKSGRIVGVKTVRQTYESQVVALAVGGRSRLRDIYFGSPKIHRYGSIFYNASVACPDDLADSAYYALGLAGLAVLVPLPGGTLRLGLQYTTKETREGTLAGRFEDDARRRFQALRNADLRQVASAQTYELVRTATPNWTIPGAVVLGDASRQVHPAGGQDMNLAIADADLLANHLRRAGGAAPARLDEAMSNYAQARRKAIRPVVLRTDVMGRLSAVDRAAAIRLRGRTLRLADRSDVLKRLVMRRVMDVA